MVPGAGGALAAPLNTADTRSTPELRPRAATSKTLVNKTQFLMSSYRKGVSGWEENKHFFFLPKSSSAIRLCHVPCSLMDVEP